MEIISLIGPTESGKSPTLNLVYNIMLQLGYTQLQPGHFRILGNPVFNDVFDVLEKKGRKIGFAMMGDFEKAQPENTVQELLQELEQLGCHIAICACNEDLHEAIAFIKTYSHVFIGKTIERNIRLQPVVNGNDAEKILRLL